MSTPRNIRRHAKYPPSLENLISLVEFPMPSLDNELLSGSAEAAWTFRLRKFGCLVNRRPNQGCVGFGRECKLSKDQVFEIAHGIVLFELPFLWALRKPSCAVHDLDAMAPLNATALVEKGLAVEIERTEDGSFSRD
ncbi:hypothetical protein POTOM_046599 [Populus tomentosa]|nr:hypothetical protein POTOM_046599 [Populus tomentosa]